MEWLRRNKIPFASALLMIFHLIGLAQLLMGNENILRFTPVNLLLSFLLMLITTELKPKHFLLWSLIFVLGYGIEWIGVHSGLLFGDYQYGNILGPLLSAVPPIIGLNWLLVLWGAQSMAALWTNNFWLRALLSAAAMTMLDVLIEPMAMHYHFWDWAIGRVPEQNYIAWFICGFLLSVLWQKSGLYSSENKKEKSFLQTTDFAACCCYISQTIFFGGWLFLHSN